MITKELLSYNLTMMNNKHFRYRMIFLFALFNYSVSIAQDSTDTIASLNAKVTSFRFYHSGERPIAKEQRDYKNRFERALTMRVNWELGLEFPKSTQQRSAKVEEYWYDYKDRVLKHQFYDVVIGPNFSSAFCDHNFGWNRPGNWQNGSYRLDLFVDKKKIVSGSFEIYEGSTHGVTEAQREAQPAEFLCDAVVGKWKWFTGGEVTINKDGTLQHNPGNDGTWQCTQTSPPQFTIKWRVGGFINKMILSEDQKSLTSADRSQSYVTAKRIETN